MSAAILPDGRVRLYAFVNEGPGFGSIRSAISQDGIHFTVEPGTRFVGGQARIVPLDGGGWRLFFTAANGIDSATSTDGLTFVGDPGTRINNAQAGLNGMTVGSVVRLTGGGYRMYFSSSPPPSGGPSPPDYILSATSTNLLDWNVEPGVRIGPGATLTGSAVHPFALANQDGTVTLLYEGQRFPSHFGFFYSTSRDGLAFTKELVADLAFVPGRLGTVPGDPDLIARPDGSYLMYYDQFDPAIGTEIHAARVTTDNDLALSIPTNITVIAHSPGGATLSYATPTAVDEDVTAPIVSCDRLAAFFPIGRTTVHCEVSDTGDANSPVTATFTVTVVGCLVPKVTGKTLSQAKRSIKTAHCAVGRVTYAPPRVKKDIVIAQSPRPGRALKAGARVDLVVSRR